MNFGRKFLKKRLISTPTALLFPFKNNSGPDWNQRYRKERAEPIIQVSSERIEGERIVLIYFLSDVILGGWVGELKKRHMTLFELKIDL